MKGEGRGVGSSSLCSEESRQSGGREATDRMTDPEMFSFFLGSVILSNLLSLILFRYCKTISPANQNILYKLSCWYILCLNLVNTSQVTVEISKINIHFSGGQGLAVLLRSAAGPLSFTLALAFRCLYFTGLFLGLASLVTMAVLRLVIVFQVGECLDDLCINELSFFSGQVFCKPIPTLWSSI